MNPWIKVTDRLPEYRKSSLAIGSSDEVLVTDGLIMSVAWLTYEFGFDGTVLEEWCVVGDSIDHDDITHWMLLPELPCG